MGEAVNISNVFMYHIGQYNELYTIEWRLWIRNGCDGFSEMLVNS